jgi:hypothetical protein
MPLSRLTTPPTEYRAAIAESSQSSRAMSPSGGADTVTSKTPTSRSAFIPPVRPSGCPTTLDSAAPHGNRRTRARSSRSIPEHMYAATRSLRFMKQRSTRIRRTPQSVANGATSCCVVGRVRGSRATPARSPSSGAADVRAAWDRQRLSVHTNGATACSTVAPQSAVACRLTTPACRLVARAPLPARRGTPSRDRARDPLRSVVAAPAAAAVRPPECARSGNTRSRCRPESAGPS